MQASSVSYILSVEEPDAKRPVAMGQLAVPLAGGPLHDAAASEEYIYRGP